MEAGRTKNPFEMYITDFSLMGQKKKEIIMLSRQLIRYYKGGINLEYILKMGLEDFINEVNYADALIKEENKENGK